jgi:hypothetical protein
LRSCADPRRLAAIAAAAVLACSFRSPASEVKQALAQLAPVELDVTPNVRVWLGGARFSDVAVSMDGSRALVVAMLEADGRVRIPGGDPVLAYVGRESFAMERCPEKKWCLAPDALSGLRGVAAALAVAPRQKGTRPRKWQVRVERESAEVGEDFEVDADGSRRRSRFSLAFEGGAWSPKP